MEQKLSIPASHFPGRQFFSDSQAEVSHLLTALFGSSTVGVAIFDRQLRYRAINEALASANGIPAEAHIGKTIQTVLGSAASKIQPAFEHVFTTGEPLSNCEVTAELPTRAEAGHWSVNYFPIRDDSGKVRHVGAIVLELTTKNRIESALARLTGHLLSAGAALRNTASSSPAAGVSKGSLETDPLRTSAGLLDHCISEAQAISHLLHSAPLLIPEPPRQPRQSSRRRRALRELPRRRSFASVSPVSDERHHLSPLSAREHQIIALLAAGKTNKQIATVLTISCRTVETHRARIMLKLRLHSVSDLVRYALRNRFIQP